MKNLTKYPALKKILASEETEAGVYYVTMDGNDYAWPESLEGAKRSADKALKENPKGKIEIESYSGGKRGSGGSLQYKLVPKEGSWVKAGLEKYPALSKILAEVPNEPQYMAISEEAEAGRDATKAKVVWFNKNKGYGEVVILNGPYKNAEQMLWSGALKNPAMPPKSGDILEVELKRGAGGPGPFGKEDKDMLGIWSAQPVR